MKVKTLKAHSAGLQDRQIGEVYEHPNPKAELTLGLVEEYADDSKAEGDEGTGKGFGKGKGRNGKK